MNAIEDRLREALAERARYSPIDPDAWAKTVARTRAGKRRPARSPAWSRFLMPAAAAATVVAIVLGATVVIGHGIRHGGRAASVTPVLPGPDDYLIQQDPPVSAIVPVQVSASGPVKWIFVWFARMKGSASQGTVLCSEVRSGQSVIAATCESVRLSARQAAVLTSRDSTAALGAAGPQVTSVSAQLPGGRHLTGRLISGRGFPAQVWLLRYPYQEGAGIVFRDAYERQVAHLTIAGAAPFPPVRPQHGGITVSRSPGNPITAYLIGGRVRFWYTGGVRAASSLLPAGGPPDVAVFLGQGTAKGAQFFGYAHENVARVTVRLADGRQFTGRTLPGWAGSGIRLWAMPPEPAGTSRQLEPLRYVALGYDAAGHVVWQETSASGLLAPSR